MAGCTQAALPRAVNLSGFSREVDPPPWQGEAARPVQACLCAPSVWSRRSPGAGQASRRRRRERNGRKRRAGRGRGGGAEDSAEALGTGLSLSATRRLPHPSTPPPPGGPGQVFVLSAKTVLTVGHFFADPATLNQSALP